MPRSLPATPGLSRAFVEDHWLGPWWLERQRDESSLTHVPAFDPRSITNYNFRASTTVGNLDAERLARVDPRGLVVTTPGRWSLDWWIGADDRWHVPSQEATLRQRLLDGAPVVETLLRVPSGDAIQRVYVTRAGVEHREVVVVEIENASTLPIAVAFAVRPYDDEALGGISAIQMLDEAVLIDGEVGVIFPRVPSRSSVSTFEQGDSAVDVLTGEAPELWTGGVQCPHRLAQAAFVFPLAHRATMRVVLPLSSEAPSSMGSLPSAEKVAKGWNIHARRGLQADLPSSRLADAFAANRNFLLLARGGLDPGSPDGRLYLAALDRCGYHDEVVAALDGAAQQGSVLHAQIDHWAITGDDEWFEGVKRRWSSVGSFLRYRGSSRRALRELIDQPQPPLVEFEPTRLGHARRRPSFELRQAVAEIGRGEGTYAAERIEWALEVASPTYAWPSLLPPDLLGASRGEGHHRDAAAAYVLAVRSMLVHEMPDGETLALCSILPRSWQGEAIEVHDAPTTFGLVSYAVRWHGARPALLWELQPHALAGGRPMRVTAPGLDPGWASTELSGEALLEVPA